MGTAAELERRHAELLVRCALQREAVAALGDDILRQAASCDAGLVRIRRWLSSPVALAAGVVLAWTIGRGGRLSRLGRVAGLLGSASRLRRLL